MKKLIFAAAAATVISAPAFAAPTNTDSADGSATATVVAPITLTHVSNAVLNFGTFTAGTDGGTVVVTRAGNGSETGDVITVAGSTNSSDQFTVAGDAGRAFTVSTDDSTVDSGTNSMAFTTNAAVNGTLDGSGAATFNVGGTLTVGANQAAGVYTGTYNATVTYN